MLIFLSAFSKYFISVEVRMHSLHKVNNNNIHNRYQTEQMATSAMKDIRPWALPDHVAGVILESLILVDSQLNPKLILITLFSLCYSAQLI